VSRSAAVIDRAREREARKAVRSMPDLCTISTPGTPANDGSGGFTQTPTTQPNVPCRVRDTTGSERNVVGAITEKVSVIVEIPATFAVSSDASIIVAARGLQGERTFQVVAPLLGSDDPLLRLLATEG
jgi:hypothetical protein